MKHRKLSPYQLVQVLKHIAKNVPMKDIALKFKVSYATIVKIESERVTNIQYNSSKHNNTSLCCYASTYWLHQPNAMENEYDRIMVCSECQSEAPNEDMFTCSQSQLRNFFIKLNQHKTINK